MHVKRLDLMLFCILSVRQKRHNEPNIAASHQGSNEECFMPMILTPLPIASQTKSGWRSGVSKRGILGFVKFGHHNNL